MKSVHILLPISYFIVYFGGTYSLLFFLIVALLFTLFHQVKMAVSLPVFILLGMMTNVRDEAVRFSQFSFDYALRDELAHYILAHNGNDILLSLATGHRFFDESFREALAISGSYHLIAISAMHIGVIMGIMLFVSRWITVFVEKPSLQWAISRLFAYGGTAWYLMITGGSLPTIRAFFFFIFADLIFSFGVAAHPLFLLLLSLVVTSLIVPGSVETMSFALSAVSVGGVLLLWKRMPRSSIIRLILISLLLQFLLAPLLADMNGYIVMQSPLVALLTIPLLALCVPLIFLLQFSMLFPFDFLHSSTFVMADFVTLLLQEIIRDAKLFSEHLLLPVSTFSVWMKVTLISNIFLLLYIRNRVAKVLLLFVVLILFLGYSTALFRVKQTKMVWRKKVRVLCISNTSLSGTLAVMAGGYGGWVYRARVSLSELSVMAAKCGFVKVNRIVLGRGVGFNDEKALKKRIRFSHCRISDISQDFTGVADRYAVTHEDNPSTSLLW